MKDFSNDEISVGIQPSSCGGGCCIRRPNLLAFVDWFANGDIKGWIGWIGNKKLRIRLNYPFDYSVFAVIEDGEIVSADWNKLLHFIERVSKIQAFG